VAQPLSKACLQTQVRALLRTPVPNVWLFAWRAGNAAKSTAKIARHVQSVVAPRYQLINLHLTVY